MSAIEINDDIEQLSNFIQAVTLLAKVLNHGSAFTDNIMPTNTEQFLEDASLSLTAVMEMITKEI